MPKSTISDSTTRPENRILCYELVRQNHFLEMIMSHSNSLPYILFFIREDIYLQKDKFYVYT